MEEDHAMALEHGSVRAEQVTAGMDLLCRGAWRPVLADADVMAARNGKRARIVVGRAGTDATDTVDLVAHSMVRVRPRQP
ncbi:alkyl hydroperoxide reductase subunit AhpF [Catenulispora sp. GP43]|uniref:hypothetical protein n=1 Tax=Catenulispora sp. GP43 TaxID=3156263 RepID=UPI003516CDB0